MPGRIVRVLGGPISGLLDSVGSILDRVVTTDKDRLEAQRELVTLERQFQTRVMELDQDFASTQAEVVQQEMRSQSWMAKNWRPILMLTFTYIVAHNFVIAPLFGMPMAEVPEQMWTLLQIGMGGYIFGRTVEKTAPTVTAMFGNKK
jgi:hypothetical protein